MFDAESGACLYEARGNFGFDLGQIAVAETPETAGIPLQYLRYQADTDTVTIDVSGDPTVALVDGQIVPSLEAAKLTVRGKLREACRTAITGGIACDALGAPHQYPTQNSAENPDQLNLWAVYNRATQHGDAGGPYWIVCQDVAGAWDARPHSAAQAIAVGDAVDAHVQGCRAQLRELLALLDDPGTDTAEKVAAIVWPAATAE
ncbi:hypothetical protein [Methylogaea oryzae]|uniref:DUF4376 domain-containing protein n=1 Tax=Methylogaea oryzae TaxID=1295382 RepID=UPI0012E2818A|nr:hypothetical protein [Methylogaea oryzae]